MRSGGKQDVQLAVVFLATSLGIGENSMTGWSTWSTGEAGYEWLLHGKRCRRCEGSTDDRQAMKDSILREQHCLAML